MNFVKVDGLRRIFNVKVNGEDLIRRRRIHLQEYNLPYYPEATDTQCLRVMLSL